MIWDLSDCYGVLLYRPPYGAILSINNLPKLDLYRRIVQAKLFIDSNYTEERLAVTLEMSALLLNSHGEEDSTGKHWIK